MSSAPIADPEELRRREEQEIHEGTEASRILDSETFSGMVELVKERIWRDWLGSGQGDTESRERLYVKWHALNEVIGELRTAQTSGRLAEQAQEIRKQQRERSDQPEDVRSPYGTA